VLRGKFASANQKHYPAPDSDTSSAWSPLARPSTSLREETSVGLFSQAVKNTENPEFISTSSDPFTLLSGIWFFFVAASLMNNPKRINISDFRGC